MQNRGGRPGPIAYNEILMNPMLRFDCPYRILFGPLYTGSILGRWLAHPNIRTFAATRSVTMSERNPFRPLQADIHYDAEQDDFAAILAALPPGWEPDLVIWYNLALHGVPAGIEDCPWPTLAIVHDAHLELPMLLDYVQAFDYVVADQGFADILARQGYSRAAYWPCYAHDANQHFLLPGLERVYDVVFPGNLSYHYHGGRNRWLQRLLRLDDKYRILISDRAYGPDYLRLLNQSKLVFNYSVRGEMNMRVYEAAACGAAVLCESGNREIRHFLVDRASCILYDEDNLETLIDYYLSHDAERQRIAAAGTAAIATQDCEHQFARLLELIPEVQQAFASGARQKFRAVKPIWRELLREKQFAQSRTPKARPRSQAEWMVAARDLRPAAQAHFLAVLGALQLKRHWDATRLLQPQPLPSEAGQAVQMLETAARALPEAFWLAYTLASGYTLLRRPMEALQLWARLIPQLQALAGAAPESLGLSALGLDAASLSLVAESDKMPANPSGTLLWDSTLGAQLQLTLGRMLAGEVASAELLKLMLHQAHELSAYCLMWIKQPQSAIQAFLAAEALGPESFFTYAPLLQLLFQTGRQAELLACLQRACDNMGLTESFLRDRIVALRRSGDSPSLAHALSEYRQLMQRIEGGGPQAAESLQAWIPGLMAWIPELMTQPL